MCQKTCLYCEAPRYLPYIVCKEHLDAERAAERREMDRWFREPHFKLAPVYEHSPYQSSPRADVEQSRAPAKAKEQENG